MRALQGGPGSQLFKTLRANSAHSIPPDLEKLPDRPQEDTVDFVRYSPSLRLQRPYSLIQSGSIEKYLVATSAIIRSVVRTRLGLGFVSKH